MLYHSNQVLFLRVHIFVIAALASLTIAACSHEGENQAAMPPPEVDAARVLVKSIRQWDEFTGRIAATDTVNIRARVSGYIERIAFKEGDEVKAGDLLFVIDQRPYRAAHKSAVAQLQHARASAQLAKILKERAQALMESNAISRDELETRRTSMTQSHADVRAAEAAEETARLNFEFTEVRSPITGRVSRALLTKGNLVQADQSILTSIVSLDPVYVYFQPSESIFLRYSRLASNGKRATSDNLVRVGLADDQDYPYTGTMNFVNNQVDPDTGTITLRAVLPNPERVFTPGLYARVQLESGSEFKAILIDQKAVMTDQNRKYVYVIDDEGKAQRKDIVPGKLSDGLLVVQSGLDANDVVIVAGQLKIFAPGTPVKPTIIPMDTFAAASADSSQLR
jgi:multidrug efflux system membrane fusion protein